VTGGRKLGYFSVPGDPVFFPEYPLKNRDCAGKLGTISHLIFILLIYSNSFSFLCFKE